MSIKNQFDKVKKQTQKASKNPEEYKPKKSTAEKKKKQIPEMRTSDSKPTTPKPKKTQKVTLTNTSKTNDGTTKVPSNGGRYSKEGGPYRNVETKKVEEARAKQDKFNKSTVSSVTSKVKSASEKEKANREKAVKKTSKQAKKEYFGTASWQAKSTAGSVSATVKGNVDALKEQGYSNKQVQQIMDANKDVLKEQVKDTKKAYKDAVSKQIDKGVRKSINKEANKVAKESAKQAFKDSKFRDNRVESLAQHTGVTTTQAKKQAKDNAKAYAEAYKNNPALMGISDSVPIVSDIVGAEQRAFMSDKDKKTMEEGKSSKAYKVSRGAGELASYIIPGTAAYKGLKAANAATKGAKAMNLLRRTGKATAYNTPLNAYYSARQTAEEDGKLTAGGFAKNMAINTGADFLLGGAMEGVGGAYTKTLSNKAIKLLAKERNNTITKAEKEELDKLVSKLTKKASEGKSLGSDIANDVVPTLKEGNVDASINSKELPTVTGGKGAEAKGGEEWVAKRRDARAVRETVNDFRQTTDAIDQDLAKGIETPQTKTNAGYNRKLNKIQQKVNEGKKLTLEEEVFKAQHNLQIGKRVDEVFEGEVKKNSNRMLQLQMLKNELEKTPKKYGKRIKELESGIAKIEKELEGTLKGGERRVEELKAQAIIRLADETPTTAVTSQADELVEASDNVAPKTAETPSQKSQTDIDIANTKANISAKEREGKGITYQMNQNAEEYRKALDSGDEVTAKDLQKQNDALRKQRDQIDAERDAYKQELAELEGKKAKEQNYQMVDDDVPWASEGDKASYEASQRAEKVNATDSPEEIIKADPLVSEAKAKEIAKTNKELGFFDRKLFDEGGVDMPAAMEKEVARTKDGTRRLLSDAYRRVVNSFSGFERLANDLGDPKERTRIKALVQKLRMSSGKSNIELLDDYHSIWKKSGLVGNKEKAADFEKYCFLKHDIDRLRKDTEFLGFKNEADINAEIKALEEKWGEKEIQNFQKDIVGYFKKQLQKEVDAGICTPEDAKKLLEDYENYIPTMRDGEFAPLGNVSTSNELSVANLKKAVGGSDIKIHSLWEQGIIKTTNVNRRVAMNDLYKYIGDMLSVDKETVEHLADTNTTDEIMEAGTYVFDGGKKGYHAVYYVNGEKVTMRISEDMYRGIKEWSGQERSAVLESRLIANGLTKGVNKGWKALITDYDVIFGVRNFVRDTKTAFYYTEDAVGWTKNMVANVPKAIVAATPDTILKKLPKGSKLLEMSDHYKFLKEAYRKSGGQFGQFVSSDPSEATLKKAVNSKMNTANKINPFSYVKKFNATLEFMPRFAEFSSSLESELKKQMGDQYKELDFSGRLDALESLAKNPEVLDEAMYRAKEVTLNFERSGYIGRRLNNTVVPFFNPSIQGLDKLGRVLLTERKSKRLFLGMASKLAIGGTGIEILWQSTIGQMPEYQELSDYNKQNYHCFPLVALNNIPGMEGTFKRTDFIKFPKARETAGLNAPVDWIFQHAIYHSDGVDHNLVGSAGNSLKMAWEQIGPINPIEDNILATPIRIGKNKNWYGGNINDYDDVDLQMAGKSDKVGDENTTDAARLIARGLNKNADMLLERTPLGSWDSTRKFIKKNTWTAKQVDELLSSELSVIYDLGMKPTSAKGGANGDNGILKNTKKMLTSQFGTAFLIDSTMSNNHSTNVYGRIDQLNKDLDTEEKGTLEYDKKYAEKYYLKRQTNARAGFKEIESSIYLREDLSPKQKRFWAAQIRKKQYEIMSNADSGSTKLDNDPFAWAMNQKKKNGDKLFTNDQIIDMCSYENSDGQNAMKNAWTKYKAENPKDKDGKKFMEFTRSMRDLNMKSGEDLSFNNYTAVALVGVARGQFDGKDYKGAMQAWGITDRYYDYDIKNAEKYLNDYKGTLKTYESSHSRIIKSAVNLGTYGTKFEAWNNAIALANSTTKNGNKMQDRAYFVEGKKTLERQNYARCLASDKYKDSKWTDRKIYKWANTKGWTDSEDGLPSDKELSDAIEKKWGGKTREEKAAVFGLIKPNAENPYGEVGDYSLDSDKGASYDNDGSGRRRRGHRRGRHGHGGGGGRGKGGSAASTSTKKTANVKVSDVTTKSNLNDAYRKQYAKLRSDAKKKEDKLDI